MHDRSPWMTGLTMTIVAWSSWGCQPATPKGSVPTTTVPQKVVQQVPRPVAPRSDYVGSQVCSECHREIADSYSQHPMGQSSALIGEARAIEDYTKQTSYDTPDGHRYVVEQSDGRTLHHEQFRTPSGEALYDQAVAVDLSIGSGRRGRSYAFLSGNRYFQSPISWYTGKERWDMSPGYVPDRPPRFDRLLTEECLLCHVGRLNPGSAPNTWDEKEPIAEAAIGCERCHGPGASHVDRYRNAAAFQGIDAIVNPGKLDPVRRDAVCHQCHLQASKTIPRYGRTSHDFRPGDRLCDVWVVLKGSIDDRKSLTQSGQMVSSRCYQESVGKLGCISCHNPHGLPKGDPAAHFDAKCAKCHGASHGECSLSITVRNDRTCIGCHMPRFPLTDVPHTALTDHRILRRPDFSMKKAESMQPTSVVFEEGEPFPPGWEIRRARALALRMDASQEKAPEDIARATDILRSLEPFLADDPEISAMLAWLADYQNNSARMEQAARRTLELDPHRYEAQELLLRVLIGKQAWSEGEALCRQLIAQDPSLAMYHEMLANVLFRQGHIQEGIIAAEKALTCDPTQRGIRQRLIEMYKQSGDLRRAAEHQAVLSRLPPRHP